MKRSMMSILTLAGALALGGFACDDDGDGNNDAAVKMDGSGLTGGGAGGSAGNKTDGGAGTGTAGSGGNTTDGGAGTGGAKADGGGADGPHAAGADGGSADGGKPLIFATCTTEATMVAASTDDFCDYYETSCSTFLGGGQGKFANRAECAAKYAAYTATQKSCTTYHLCVAGTSAAMATAHCPHPAGGGSDPCNIIP